MPPFFVILLWFFYRSCLNGFEIFNVEVKREANGS